MIKEQLEKEYENSYRRRDIVAFIVTFFVGFLLYVFLHRMLHLNQLLVTISILLTMVVYAWIMYSDLSMRVRMDQAGDNAYYLGLLFTLISMAFSLYDFGSAVALKGSEEPVRAGTQQIIANFGIALGTTITGIFLRVLLNQMRIDPADIEQKARIELAEAANKVKDIINTVTIDIGNLQSGIKQRFTDTLTSVIEDSEASADNINRVVEIFSKEIIDSVGKAQREIQKQIDQLTKILGGAVTETEELTNAFERMDTKTENITKNMHETAESANTILEVFSNTTKILEDIINSISSSHVGVSQNVEGTTKNIIDMIDPVVKRLEDERTLLDELNKQYRNTIRNSEFAPQSAIGVLKNFKK